VNYCLSLQHIVVLIDSRLVSESCGASILTCLNTSGVRYEVGDQIQPYIISFSREQAIVKESEAKKVSRALQFQKTQLLHDVLCPAISYHSVCSVITAHELTPVKRDD